MTRPIRALFLSHSADLSGAVRSLLALLENLDPAVVQSVVVAPAMGRFLRAVEKLGIRCYVHPLTRWVPYRQSALLHCRNYASTALRLHARSAALRALVEREDIDVVYTNSVCSIEGALAARAAKRPHIWHVREYIGGNRDLRPLLPASLSLRIIAAVSDHVITNSRALQSVFDGLTAPGATSVVHNGVDLAEFTPDRSQREPLRKRLDLDPACSVVTIVGAINPRKGHLLFTEAAARVGSRIENTAFVVVGAGETQFLEGVKARVRQHGLESRFRFMGWQPAIADILRGSDVPVLASEQEAFGRTLIEAMAAGIPVVATRSGGPEEIVVPGETGFLVPTGDAAAMADAIAAILEDPALAGRMGAAARETAQRHFSLEAYARGVESILTRVAGSGRSDEYRVLRTRQAER